MFALFYSLYCGMFTGQWYLYSLSGVKLTLQPIVNTLGQLITSIFNNVDQPLMTLGDVLLSDNSTYSIPNYIALLSFVLALITSIGIVVMAAKGVKKAFGIFFMGLRR